MRRDETHPTQEELVLAADGELPARRITKIQEHVERCAECTARQQEIGHALGDFVHDYQQSLDPLLPPAAAQRALMRAQIAEMSAAPTPFWGRLSLAGATLGLALVSAIGIASYLGGRQTLAVPRSNLTPGAARAVNREQLCRADLPKNQVVPVTLQRQVFAAYGIPAADPRAYEVDYLITPALGGSDDVRNLWPQPYGSTVWNAAVKDALEDRLHDMVCRGELDLSTAQRDISHDWIAAYKKYFHAAMPLPDR